MAIRKEDKKRPRTWLVTVSEDARYKASLIATLYKLRIGDVLERAIICYANVIRIGEKMEKEFPKQGLDTPPKSGEPRRPPKLTDFTQHEDFFKTRKQERTNSNDAEA